MLTQQIGKMVRFHRKQAGLSQKELGQLAGLGKTVVFNVEKGQLSMRLDTLLKLLNVLNITIDFFGPLMPLFKESVDDEKS
jgi:transcriptional regulator with XRE-family HTH domain